MRRPKEIRAPPKEWIAILSATYSFLRGTKSIGDLVLFGSQALSLYMKTPLRSKDLDLLSTQVGLPIMEELSSKLSRLQDVESRSTTVQTKMFDIRKARTYAIELRVSGKPFFVELFDAILDGRPTFLLDPYVTLKKRWGFEIWVPEREAVVALRLAFRQPEGISRFNATRLNSFIEENKCIRFNRVTAILENWAITSWVEKNLVDLYKLHRLRITGDNKIIPGIKKKLS